MTRNPTPDEIAFEAAPKVHQPNVLPDVPDDISLFGIYANLPALFLSVLKPPLKLVGKLISWLWAVLVWFIPLWIAIRIIRWMWFNSIF